jgi:hypothetical protein
MGQINSKPKKTVICSLCYDSMIKNNQTIIKPCKHKLCKSCYHSYNMNYKDNFCPLCNNNSLNNF